MRSIIVKHNIIQLFIMFVWIAFLYKSDSYFVVYLLVGILGILCLSFYKNDEKVVWGQTERPKITLASTFSLAVIAANYKLFSEIAFPDVGIGNSPFFFKALELLVTFPIIFLGGMFHMFYILKYMEQKAKECSWREYEYKINGGIIFGIVMILITFINTTILYLCYYPGILTPDSISQIKQILNGVYSNHHPFYHTMVIRLCLKIGTWLFGNINCAVAVYSMFSIVSMAAIFAYVSMTLYQMKINIKIIIAVTSVYTLLPCHICYSMTMWKDVIFGECVLLFIVSIFRHMEGMGNIKYVNIGIMAVSALGICLFRSNGYFAFIITVIAFVVLLGKQYPRICMLFLGVLVLSYMLKYPVLKYLGVTQPDTIESLSIPAQQIARVVTDCNNLSDRQKELLSEIIDLDEIANMYTPYISDPIKGLVRAKGNQEYLIEHKFEYLALYIEVGLAHPVKYIEAWIDQTEGYWNGGNSYAIWDWGVWENTFGIERTSNSQLATLLMKAYLWYFRNIEVLKLFLSIGLHTWITVLVGWIGYINNSKKVMFLTIPALAVIVSLLVATPVYSEFRYAYVIFCCIPFLIVIPFWKHN